MILLFSTKEFITLAEITQGQQINVISSVDNFDIYGFADFVDNYGQNIKYYQSILCDCVATNNGHPNPSCDCDNGYRYPFASISRKLLRTGVSNSKRIDRAGAIDTGQCHISIPAIYLYNVSKHGRKTYQQDEIYSRIAVGDVFVIEGKRRRDRDILKKGARDTLRAFDVQNIFSCTSQGETYTYGTDYRFKIKTREIIWSGSHVPADNQNYTVEFESYIQYIVFNDVDADRGTHEDYLPKKMICNLRTYQNFETTVFDS